MGLVFLYGQVFSYGEGIFLWSMYFYMDLVFLYGTGILGIKVFQEAFPIYQAELDRLDVVKTRKIAKNRPLCW